MGIYVGVGSAAKALSKLYVGVGGTAKAVQKMYVGVDGKARLVWQLGTPLSEKAVGSTVKIKVNGTAKEFIVVQQGNPSPSTSSGLGTWLGIYDDSCDGTWLLMKDIYEERKWTTPKSLVTSSPDDNEYSKSEIYTYLNGTFYGLIESSIKNLIKQVKIPYCTGSAVGNKTVTTGADGLSTKIFLLSATEVNFEDSADIYAKEGKALSYFSGCSVSGADSKRVAKLSGTQKDWFTRTPYRSANGAGPIHVMNNGGYDWSGSANSKGIRPAFILPSDTMVDESGNVIA